MHAQRKIALVAVCALLGTVGIAGCAPQTNEALATGDQQTPQAEGHEYTDEQQSIIDGEEGTVYDGISLDAYPGKDYLDGMHDMWDANVDQWAPELRTLPSGQIVQRTPSELAERARQGKTPYNIYRLNNDNRGCNSCHADLDATLQHLAQTMHPSPNSPALDAEMTVDQCLFCHTYSPGYIPTQYEFGTLIHNIHYGLEADGQFEDEYKGNCYSCHDATNDGEGMALWDQTKFERLRGVTKVENVEGDFSIDQEATMAQEDMFNMDAWNRLYDRMRSGAEYADTPMPQSLFDSWPITVDGEVNSPYTALLPDLVKEAEAAGVTVTKVSKEVCNWNGTGAGSVSNVEITGIPVSWLIERAGGYADNADINGVRVMRADGSSKRAMPLDKVDGGEAFLVYKINGEQLTAANGFPCTNWCEGVDPEVNSKQMNEYKVVTDAPNFDDHVYEFEHHDGNPNGWIDADGNWTNKPNATVLGVPEGLVIQNGQPQTFHGYVDAYDEKIASVEFSMDFGKTWTKHDLGDTDVNKLVWFDFTWTPQEESAYCLQLRATTESGLVSPQIQTVMVNAKDAMPAADQTVVIDTPSLVAPKTAAAEAAEGKE